MLLLEDTEVGAERSDGVLPMMSPRVLPMMSPRENESHFPVLQPSPIDQRNALSSNSPTSANLPATLNIPLAGRLPVAAGPISMYSSLPLDSLDEEAVRKVEIKERLEKVRATKLAIANQMDSIAENSNHTTAISKGPAIIDASNPFFSGPVIATLSPVTSPETSVTSLPPVKRPPRPTVRLP